MSVFQADAFQANAVQAEAPAAATAFQENAWQQNFIQILGGGEAGIAFQANAFQGSAFQTDIIPDVITGTGATTLRFISVLAKGKRGKYWPRIGATPNHDTDYERWRGTSPQRRIRRAA